MEDKELVKKMSNLFEESKRKKITDFDTGLLSQSFEPITGTPEERYEKWCSCLVNVASRLENLYKDDKERLPILKKIDDFFKEELPGIRTEVSDYREKTRVILLHVEGSEGEYSCVPESLRETIKSIREEQYNDLSNRAKVLLAKARGRLDEDLFLWHRKGVIREVQLKKRRDDNGRNK